MTFVYTGGEQTYTVPAGVSSLQVQAVGANGGYASPLGTAGGPVPGGAGGMVIGELSVGAVSAITPGETLYVAVGGTPTKSNGGFNGGGSGNDGGGSAGGGGASDVRACSRTSPSCANGVTSLLARLIVAGGGGGAGGCVLARSQSFCGRGGSAGGPGGPGRSSRSLTIPGGGAGTLVAPGAGGGEPSDGHPQGNPGSSIDGTGGQGGSPVAFRAPSPGGGGGGGGNFGGGGGAAPTVVPAMVATGDVPGGGGGGGGANFASPFAVSGVSTAAGDGTPRLLITRGRSRRSASAGSTMTRPAPTGPPTRASTPSSCG